MSVIMPHDLNLHSAVCQLHPNETENKNVLYRFLKIQFLYAHSIFFQYMLVPSKFPQSCLLSLEHLALFGTSKKTIYYMKIVV